MTRKAAATFRRFGFRGPLWITETGYPSDPAYQGDAGFRAGPRSQAAYMRAAVPAMLGAGASSVFVTLRDGEPGWGLFESEGVLSWPGLVPKPSYRAVSDLGAGLIRRAGRRAARARAARGSARVRARRHLERARRRGRSRASSHAAR